MSNYWVAATLCEPKYADEWKFLAAELAVVERILAKKHRHGLWNLPVPALGLYGRRAWQKYQHELRQYATKLDKYAHGADEGVLPVKFVVHNDADTADQNIRVQVKVEHGRIDELRKVPERPKRLDGHAKPFKFVLPPLGAFVRRKIKVTAHGVGAEFSRLGPHDGAVLVNQVLHIHCTDKTQVTYTLKSRSVAHETGAVELED